MRSIAPYALAVTFGLFFAAAASRVEATLSTALQFLDVTNPRASSMTEIVRTKPGPDGAVHAMRWTQQAGETAPEFRARAAREWAAYCAELGG